MKKKETEKESAKVTDISVHIASLAARFKPAHNVAETTHWFSTQEVMEAIKDIDPGAKVDTQLIHDALVQAGFSYRSRPGAQSLLFRWMFRAID